MTTRPRPTGLAAVGLAALLALVGCSGEETRPEATEPRAPAAPTTPTEPPPTPEEAAAEAALAVFEERVRVSEAAAQAPAAQDWEPEIRRYSIDPAAAASVEGVELKLELGIIQVGESDVEPEVTAVDLTAQPGPTVSLTACYDTTNSDLVFADTGKSIVPPGAPPELDRYVWLVTVVQMQDQPGSPWLVRTQDPQVSVPC